MADMSFMNSYCNMPHSSFFDIKQLKYEVENFYKHISPESWILGFSIQGTIS